MFLVARLAAARGWQCRHARVVPKAIPAAWPHTGALLFTQQKAATAGRSGDGQSDL
jgi:hypothetical protein